ncbi:MAG TPA: TonB-dependent receptor [Vicinamibacterales bacterium]|nr:TonB-dependent receptor [Vicinamibacterales bacterium]
MSLRRVLVVLVTAWTLAGATAVAQQPGTGTIRGRVLDPQNQGVPAHIRMVQRQTGLERRTQADAAGRFAITNVVPGEIEVSVEAPGFAARQLRELTIEVGSVLDLEITLQISPVQEEITVAGTAGTVDIVGSDIGTVISAREIASLPLNGRNFLELAFLAPGNAPAPSFDPTKAQSVIVSSAGGLGRGGNITIDGMDDNDDVVGGPLQNLAQDAVQEFQLVTNRFSAEHGRSAGSVINVVTRSGGDRPTGSAGLFLRDQRLQALPSILDRTGDEDPPFDRQQLFATLGGPLGLRHAFGFAALEVRNQDGGVLVGTRDTSARSITRSFVPAPLDDLLATFRLDWRASTSDDLMVRYSLQRQDDISASTLERPIGTASQRQTSRNRMHSVLGAWTRVLSPRIVNALSVSYSGFDNDIAPVEPGVQLTFPSLAGGSSFRVPQGTRQGRWQIADSLSFVRGTHNWKFGGQVQRVDARFDLGVFREGRIEFVEDFPAFDRNGDGEVTDDDLLFAVTLRSGRPDRDLVIPDADSVHLAGFVQDDWQVRPQLTLNLGLRYELDTDVNNISRVDELNPLVAPFVNGTRRRDTNNLGPRLGFNWSTRDSRTSVRGGYGLYYDRVTLQIQSLERGLDGRALPIEVRAGNVFFVDPATGGVPPFAPAPSNPFTGFILPGAGASGINIIDSRLQNPNVHQLSVGVERQLGPGRVLRIDAVRNDGRNFIIGRTVGTVFNPVVGGPDRVVNLESSAETKYEALLVEFEQRYAGRFGLRAAYTWSRAFNYANDDQIPFGSGPIDPDDLRRENGPAPNDQRHRLTLSGAAGLGAGVQLAGIWRMASGVPMDILLPDGQARVPTMSRNAGGRVFNSAAELNDFLQQVNADGGVDGEPLPLVSEAARFTDAFNSLDLRVSRPFAVGRLRVEAVAEIFNLFNITNVLGTSNRNYSGYVNALVRDSNDPDDPGYLRSTRFGTPVSTAGGVFGSGGPRALQLGARVSF